MDCLRYRRERLDYSSAAGLRSIEYREGRLAIQEVPAAAVASAREEVEKAIHWAEEEAKVLPVALGEKVPSTLREFVRSGLSDVFNSLVLASQIPALLVSDDLATREISRALGNDGGAWLHVVFGAALDSRHIDAETFVRWSAHLVDAGHGYLGISGSTLAYAARLDDHDGAKLGYIFRTLGRMIGGRIAEPESHIHATVTCLRELWLTHTTWGYRRPVTGYLLRQLIRERTGDYRPIIREVLRQTEDIPFLHGYVYSWMTGHFIANELIR